MQEAQLQQREQKQEHEQEPPTTAAEKPEQEPPTAAAEKHEQGTVEEKTEQERSNREFTQSCTEAALNTAKVNFAAHNSIKFADIKMSELEASGGVAKWAAVTDDLSARGAITQKFGRALCHEAKWATLR
jgi:hypothetical protein